MPNAQHEHRMEPVAWTYREPGLDCGVYAGVPNGEAECTNPDHLLLSHPFRPAVLLGCTRGVCAKTEVIAPKPRSRKVPAGMTPEQFNALKAGMYWPEIVGA